jgi:hypothetical protein
LKPQPALLAPASFIVSIPQGRVQQNYLGHCTSVLSGGNRLIEEVSYQANGTHIGASAAEMDIFKQKYFPTPVKYKGTVFYMLTGKASNVNYFHWLYDAIARLYLLKESGLFDQVDYFLMPALERKFHKQILEFLGLQGKKIIECKDYIHLQADNLIVSSHIRHRGIVPKWVCDYHYKSMVKPSAAKTETPSDRIYIQRGDSQVRQVLNEGQLMVLLKGYGFTCVALSNLTFAEQVNLFSSAKVIVSAHGAGLANLSFCKAGTHIIELFPRDFIEPLYQIISKRRKLTYDYILCEPEKNHPSKTLHDANQGHFWADLKQVVKKLQNVPHLQTTNSPLQEEYIQLGIASSTLAESPNPRLLADGRKGI